MGLDALDEAMAEVQEAQSLCKELKYEEGRAAMMNVATKVHMKQGELDKALTSAQDVVKLFQKLGYKRGEAAALATLAGVHWHKDEYDAQIKAATESINLFQELDDGPSIAEVCRLKMSGYLGKGDTKRAAQAMRRVVNSSQDVKQADALHTIATIEFQGNDLEKCKQANDQALEIYKRASHAAGQAACMATTIDCLIHKGNHSDAIALANERCTLLGQAGERKLEAEAYQGLGKLHLQQKDYKRADEVSQSALTMFMELRDKDGAALAKQQIEEAKQERVGAEIRAQIDANSHLFHMPDALRIEPGMNKKIQDEYNDFVKSRA